ncbi:DUF2285 domain-containing protein [Mycobacterium sp. KBS0706]|uniref:DNA -binding domain-containing protein n=1 Tax=Mycobacterium sp. KBS0706 TaxID=2578109 RepID=UPI00110FAC8B|nr:DUF2285 domain-containing protein [Mycobacterium sp. KBS0706]TSD83655.1 DUF2285 domain-containing protein [Mycobacterium sp. KBS0706]
MRAVPAARSADTFDVAALGCAATVVREPDGREHVLLRQAGRAVQLSVCSGTVLAGAVRLHYEMAGFDGLEMKLAATERLLALRRTGRLPNRLYPPPPRSERWPPALRALELARAGLSQREIAAALFGGPAAVEAWAGPSDFMRSRVRRLLRFAEAMTRGGYREVLSGRPLATDAPAPR